MDLPSVAPLRLVPRQTTSADLPEQHHSPLSRVSPLPTPRAPKILDFDCETIAAGFDDPNWVPQKITCVAWSWIDSEEVESRIATTDGLFSRPQRRRKMLEPLIEAILGADIVTGHNLLRFDLPVLNAECLRLGMPSLTRVLVQDTMKIVKTKGFKKGQDNLVALTGVPLPKLALSWQQWQDSYAERGWTTVIERCVSDVRGHKLLRQEMLDRGWLKPPTLWRP